MMVTNLKVFKRESDSFMDDNTIIDANQDGQIPPISETLSSLLENNNERKPLHYS